MAVVLAEEEEEGAGAAPPKRRRYLIRLYGQRLMGFVIKRGENRGARGSSALWTPGAEYVIWRKGTT